MQTTMSTEELIQTFTQVLPIFLRAREQFAAKRNTWGNYVLQMENLAVQREHAGDLFKEESEIAWTSLRSTDSEESQKGIDLIIAVDTKIKSAKASVDLQMQDVRRSYITELLPLYIECKASYEKIYKLLPVIVDLVDNNGYAVTRSYRTGRPQWWDSMLEHALNSQEKGTLEEELDRPFFSND